MDRALKLVISKSGHQYFCMDTDDKIVKVFYNRDSAIAYIKGVL